VFHFKKKDMKKIINVLFLFLLPAFLLAQTLHGEHVPVTEADMQAMLKPPVDSNLVEIGADVDAIIDEAIARYKESTPVNFGDWMLYAATILASFLAFMKKWGPHLQRIFENVKGDTLVYIISAVFGAGWMFIDGTVNFAEFFVKFSAVFTLAVGSYKLFLEKVWNWLRSLVKKAPPQNVAG
jgi:hypothetical protein